MARCHSIAQADEGSHAKYGLAFLSQPRFRCDAQAVHDGITPNMRHAHDPQCRPYQYASAAATDPGRRAIKAIGHAPDLTAKPNMDCSYTRGRVATVLRDLSSGWSEHRHVAACYSVSRCSKQSHPRMLGHLQLSRLLGNTRLSSAAGRDPETDESLPPEL